MAIKTAYNITDDEGHFDQINVDRWDNGEGDDGVTITQNGIEIELSVQMASDLKKVLTDIGV